MAKRVNISTARKHLPALFDRVTERDGDRVLIHRRDDGREAVLVSRSYIDRIELASRRLARGEAFDVVGSLTIVGDADGVLDEVRAVQSKEAHKRHRELASRQGGS